MKTIISIGILSGVIVLAVLCGLFCINKNFQKASAQQAEAIAQLQAEWDAQQKQSTQKKSHSGPRKVRTVSTLEPGMLIQRLSALRGAPEDQRNEIREAMYCFQGLTDAGTNALAAIRKYFESGHNITLAGALWKTLEPPAKNEGGLGTPEIFHAPASTRMGVVEVLETIGSLKAFELLSQVLPVSQDAFEVVKISQTLRKYDPTAFNERIAETAYGMLPKTEDKEGRLHLYRLLGDIGDTRWAEQLQTELVVEGRLDRDVLETLSAALGENIIPMISPMFFDPGTHPFDKNRLLQETVRFVGSNPGADEMYLSIFQAVSPTAGYSSQSMMYFNSFLVQLAQEGRIARISEISEIRGLMEANSVSDYGTLTPAVAQARLNLLETIKNTAAARQLNQSELQAVEEKLRCKAGLDPMPEDSKFKADSLFF